MIYGSVRKGENILSNLLSTVPMEIHNEFHLPLSAEVFDHFL